MRPEVVKAVEDCVNEIIATEAYQVEVNPEYDHELNMPITHIVISLHGENDLARDLLEDQVFKKVWPRFRDGAGDAWAGFPRIDIYKCLPP